MSVSDTSRSNNESWYQSMDCILYYCLSYTNQPSTTRNKEFYSREKTGYNREEYKIYQQCYIQAGLCGKYNRNSIFSDTV